MVDSPRPANILFAGLPKHLPEEFIENLIVSKNVRIERIISTDQSDPKNLWYDQEENEWIFVLRGSAVLEFAGEPKPRRMMCGDWL